MARAPRAIDNPTSTGAGDLNPEHFTPPQKPAIDMSEALAREAAPMIETEAQSLALSETEAKNEYLADIAFNEQPVTVIISKSNERNAPDFVYCAVNGEKAEVQDPRTKRWMKFGWLPLNAVITVKRKYLEVLARSRKDTVNTREMTTTPMANQDGFRLEFETVQAAPFTVRNDPAGERGMRWYDRVMTEA